MLSELEYRELLGIENKAASVSMNFIGDPQVLINLALRSQENVPHLKTVVILPGGAQKVVIQAGSTHALNELGIEPDCFVGSSGGAIVGWYAIANDHFRGSSIVWDYNVNNNVFSFRNFPKIMDVREFEKALRIKNAIDKNKFNDSKTDLHVSMTDADTGTGTFKELHGVSNPEDYIMASVCHVLYNGNDPRIIDGKSYIDGSLSQPLPITWVLDNLNPTDILILGSSPFKYKRVPSELDKKLFGLLASKLNLSKGAVKALNGYASVYNQELDYLTGKRNMPEGVRIAAIYPERSDIQKHTTNRELLKQAQLEAFAYTISKY